MLVNILLADFDHCSPMSDDVPRGLEQVSSQRVQDDINSEAIGQTHYLVLKVGVARRENVVEGDIVGIVQELALFVGSGSCKDLDKHVRDTAKFYQVPPWYILTSAPMYWQS